MNWPVLAYNSIELAAERQQDDIGQLGKFPQRMILRNPLLQRHIAEHPVLQPLVSTHDLKTHANTKKS